MPPAPKPSEIVASAIERSIFQHAVQTPNAINDMRAAGLEERHFNSVLGLWSVLCAAMDDAPGELPDDLAVVRAAATKPGTLQEYLTAQDVRSPGLRNPSDLATDLIRIRAFDLAKLQAADAAKSGDIESLTQAIAAAQATLQSADSARDLRSLRVDPTKPIVPPVPILAAGGVEVCTRGNMSVIASAPKAGKTACVGAAVSAMVCRSRIDSLGWERRTDGTGLVIYFDTEQSGGHEAINLQRIARRAELQPADTLPFLHYYTLAGMPASQARSTVRRVTEILSRRFRVDLVIVDGIGDLCGDVNDPHEAADLCADMFRLAGQIHAAILHVLHVNPGQDTGTGKTRGHLGSHLERKCESNLRIDTEEGISVLHGALRQRGAPLHRDKGPRFEWSDSLRMHASVATAGRSKEDEELRKLRPIAEEVFGSNRTLAYSNLKDHIASVMSVGQRTAERNVTRWQTIGLIQAIPGGYRLTDTTDNLPSRSA